MKSDIFTPEQLKFIADELHITKEQIDSMSGKEIGDIGDECFYIEAEEAMRPGELSPRGWMAVHIVDAINGPYGKNKK